MDKLLLTKLTFTTKQKEYFLKKISSLRFLNEKIIFVTPKVEKELIETFSEIVGFIPFLSKKVYMESPYARLVINKNVREDNKNRRLTEYSQIKYPPTKVLHNISYNRANLPKVPIFYAAFGNLAVALETKPKKGYLYTQSEWLQKKGTFLNYIPIFHKQEIALSSNIFIDEWNLYTKFLSEIDPNVSDVIRELYDFITTVFTKVVNPQNKKEYIFSALFANHFLFDKENGVDCILYPSVPSNFASQNIALKPEILEEKFDLIELVEDFCFHTGNNEKQWLSQRTAKAINPNHHDSIITWENEEIYDVAMKQMINDFLE